MSSTTFRDRSSPRSSMDSVQGRSSLSRTRDSASSVFTNALSSNEPAFFLKPAIERAQSRTPSSRRSSANSVSPTPSTGSRNSEDYRKTDAGRSSSSRSSFSEESKVRGSARSTTSPRPSERDYSPLSASFASLSVRGTSAEQAKRASISQDANPRSSRNLAAGMFDGPA